MNAFIAQAKTLADQVDEADRMKHEAVLRDALYSLERPWDTFLRLFDQHQQIAMLRVGCDLELFKILAESSGPMTIADMASKTGAASLLLGRILRYSASARFLIEIAQDTFAANATTKLMAQPSSVGAVYHMFDTIGPCVQAFPDFLKQNHYQDLTDVKNTATQTAHCTELDVFSWLSTQPEKLQYFQQMMTIERGGEWLDVFPLMEYLGADVMAETPVFVDVGGSFGQQCARLRMKYPDLPGRVICQDLPATVEHAPPIPGVDFMAQDFFHSNAVQGAKFYYLRTVLHDWPQDKCAEILGMLREACGEGSRILIDEMVLPNVGMHWEAALLDIQMGMCMAALERTRDQWEALAAQAGLRIEGVKLYLPKLGNSVIIMAPK